MKKFLIICLALLCLTACGKKVPAADVAATTAPVAQFAQRIVEGTGIQTAQVITDSVSCLHDYSLSVRQMETVSSATLVLCSGAGLEDFMDDALRSSNVADCSQGVALHTAAHGDHTHADPHIWLEPDNCAIMAENICAALTKAYPQYGDIFRTNTDALIGELSELKQWGLEELSGLSTNKIITFHDGFGYLASAVGLEIIASVEEEAGSEASAADLTEIVSLVQENDLPCVFTEVNGSDAAASVICAETGVKAYTLDTAMGGSDYFDAMRHNITTLKEALQ